LEWARVLYGKNVRDEQTSVYGARIVEKGRFLITLLSIEGARYGQASVI
jgi:hypothetical protein